MHTQLNVLIQMQKIDDVIGEKDVIKNALPNQLNDLKNQVAIASQELSLSIKDFEENAKKQKDKELEIKKNLENIRKYEHQLDSIKNNKEYKALNSEIVFLKEKNSQMENDLLIIMDEESKIKSRKSVSENNKKQADQALKENENKLKNEIIKVDVEIDDMKKQRNEIAKQLPMNLIKKYAQLIKNKNRKAVVFNLNNSCSGCGFHIRPQLLIELRQHDKINYCENCGRILVFNND